MNSLLGCLWVCRSSILPARGTRHIRQENPGRLALWAFLDWQVFLIQEECYYGKPSGLSIGELPSGSLDDQAMCLLRWSLLFRTAVPLWKLSFELECPERKRWCCFGDLARYETWGAVSQSANASFCKVIQHGLAISWRGDGSGVCNLEGLADTVEYAHRPQQSILLGLMWVLWAPRETILIAGSSQHPLSPVRNSHFAISAFLPFQSKKLTWLLTLVLPCKQWNAFLRCVYFWIQQYI